MKKKIILAYSGGLDTSIILKWLINKNYDVVCFIANVGQNEDFDMVKKNAINMGSCKVYIEDMRKEFLDDYVFQALKANAIYEGKYLLGTPLARPLIAQKQIEIARRENTHFLAHGATGKGNDQVRFELTYITLMPNVEIISPWKIAEFTAQFKGRKDMITYAHAHNIPITSTIEKPYSMDENLMHCSYEAGILEDPAHNPDNTMFRLCVSPQNAPDKETKIMVEFKKGVPISVTNQTDGKTVKGSLNLFNYLNELGKANGIGRVDLVENRFVGMKSRGVYETPAGTILLKAHVDLEGLVLDREVHHLKDMLMPKIAELIYNGFWFSPEMAFLMAAINESQKNVEGKVFMTLYKGNVWVTSRQSQKSLYDQTIASMDELKNYDPVDAQGFIKIQGLRLKLAGLKNKGATHDKIMG